MAGLCDNNITMDPEHLHYFLIVKPAFTALDLVGLTPQWAKRKVDYPIISGKWKTDPTFIAVL